MLNLSSVEDDASDSVEDNDDTWVWDEVRDLTHLIRVVFLFPTDGDDVEIVVEEPLHQYVNFDDPHFFIEDADGVGHVIPPGWFSMELHPRQGEGVF